MAFLTVNGLDIETALGGQMQPLRMGKSQRSLSGNLLRDIRSIKREWRFKTTPMAQVDAEALVAMLQGQGQHWPYDTNATADSGLTADSGTTGAVYHGANAADGDPQKLVYTTPATTADLYARNSAIWPAQATTNLLTKEASDADETGGATDGFTQINTPSTFATNATHYWQGLRSLEVADDGGADCGLETDVTADGTIINGEAATASAWVKGGSGSVKIRVQLYQADGITATEGSETTYTLAANEWRRISVSHTAANANSRRGSIQIIASTASATWYTDGLMLAQLGSLSPWVVGAGSYAEVAPSYGNPLPPGTRACTVACWCNGSARAAAGLAVGYLWNLLIDGDNRWRIYFTSSTEIPTLSYSIGGTATLSQGAAVNFGVITHLAATLDIANATQKLYVNGALADTDAISGTLWDLNNVTELTIGELTAQNLNGFVDQLIVLPQVLSATQITDLYNSGTAEAVGLPQLVCSGDFVGDASVTCLGEVSGVTYAPLAISGTWNNNAVTVEFTLREQ